MNITTKIRLSVMLLLSAPVAIATASASQDQAIKVQSDPASIHQTTHSVANATYSIQAPEQRIALLVTPAAMQSQVDNLNNSQSALSPKPQTPDEGSIVLPVIILRSRAT
jgi:hypothetical protein